MSGNEWSDTELFISLRQDKNWLWCPSFEKIEDLSFEHDFDSVEELWTGLEYFISSQSGVNARFDLSFAWRCKDGIPDDAEQICSFFQSQTQTARMNTLFCVMPNGASSEIKNAWIDRLAFKTFDKLETVRIGISRFLVSVHRPWMRLILSMRYSMEIHDESSGIIYTIGNP